MHTRAKIEAEAIGVPRQCEILVHVERSGEREMFTASRVGSSRLLAYRDSSERRRLPMPVTYTDKVGRADLRAARVSRKDERKKRAGNRKLPAEGRVLR